MTCSICSEDIKRHWLLISCPKCEQEVCRECLQKYLLHSPLDPNCMYCKAELSEDFIYKHTAKVWRTTLYKIHRERLLFDLERMKLPETQEKAVTYKDARIKLKAMRKLLREESGLLYKLYEDAETHREEILAVSERVTEQQRIIRELRRTVALFGETRGEAVRVLAQGCPNAECRGFLNEESACKLCNREFCSRCLGELVEGDNHICDEMVVSSVSAIRVDAKPCPSCGEVISKVDGCDQMWCTECHTTFSWLTGEKVLGITHNPHYYEWMRATGQRLERNPDDRVCEFPLISHIQGAFDVGVVEAVGGVRINAALVKKLGPGCVLPCRQRQLLTLLYYHQRLTHFEHVVNQGLDIAAPDNLDLRVMYLINELSEKDFKKMIYKREKIYRRNCALNQIYTMTYNVAIDLFARFLSNASIPNTNKIIAEFGVLLRHSNECLAAVGSMYETRSHPLYEVIAISQT